MIPKVRIIGKVTPQGFKVSESYFILGRRVMNRARWMQVRP